MNKLLDPIAGKPTSTCAQKKTLPCSSAAFCELSTDLLRLGKTLRFRAQGISMTPLVRNGDILVIVPATGNPIQLGDIVQCSVVPGKVVVHRVIGVEKRTDGHYFLIQGDQAAAPDGWVHQSQVFGQLTSLERNGKIIHMKNPIMRLSGLGVLWRTHRHPGSTWLIHTVGTVIKHLPVFNRLLA